MIFYIPYDLVQLNISWEWETMTVKMIVDKLFSKKKMALPDTVLGVVPLLHCVTHSFGILVRVLRFEVQVNPVWTEIISYAKCFHVSVTVRNKCLWRLKITPRMKRICPTTWLAWKLMFTFKTLLTRQKRVIDHSRG